MACVCLILSPSDLHYCSGPFTSVCTACVNITPLDKVGNKVLFAATIHLCVHSLHPLCQLRQGWWFVASTAVCAVLMSVVLQTWQPHRHSCNRINSRAQAICSPLLVVPNYNCTACEHGHFCRESDSFAPFALFQLQL